MSKVTLPKLNQTGKNEWADVEDNDVALREGVNSVANEQLAGGIEGTKLANGTITAEKLATSAAPVKWYTPKVIATEESRTNAAYGLLTTEDKIENVVLNENGLIAVSYRAAWNCSTTNGRAAIFIGANQQLMNGETLAAAAGKSGSFTPLPTTPIGLIGTELAAASPGTTGEALGVNGGSKVFYELGASLKSLEDQVLPTGTFCLIYATAGTYTISIKFKASSGSVTVKNRRLLVYTIG